MGSAEKCKSKTSKSLLIKQFKEDFKVERRLGLSREDARLTAKRTQKDGKKASPGWTLEEKQLIPCRGIDF